MLAVLSRSAGIKKETKGASQHLSSWNEIDLRNMGDVITSIYFPTTSQNTRTIGKRGKIDTDLPAHDSQNGKRAILPERPKMQQRRSMLESESRRRGQSTEFECCGRINVRVACRLAVCFADAGDGVAFVFPAKKVGKTMANADDLLSCIEGHVYHCVCSTECAICPVDNSNALLTPLTPFLQRAREFLSLGRPRAIIYDKSNRRTSPHMLLHTLPVPP